MVLTPHQRSCLHRALASGTPVREADLLITLLRAIRRVHDIDARASIDVLINNCTPMTDGRRWPPVPWVAPVTTVQAHNQKRVLAEARLTLNFLQRLEEKAEKGGSLLRPVKDHIGSGDDLLRPHIAPSVLSVQTLLRPEPNPEDEV